MGWTSSVPGVVGAALLFDGDYATCFQPLDGQDTMFVMFETSNTQFSPNVTVSITGVGLTCDQTSTVLFMSMSCLTVNAKPTQCSLSQVENVQTGMECTYVCKIIYPCDGSARVTLQMTHVIWLSGNTNAAQLCDIRAYIDVP